MIDESHDHNCEKGLVIIVRAAETSRVNTRFLDMPIVNVGSNENIFSHIDPVLSMTFCTLQYGFLAFIASSFRVTEED